MNVLIENLKEIEAVFHIMLKNRYILLAFILSIIVILIACIKDKKVREYGIFCFIVIFILLNPVFYMLIKRIYGSDGLNLYYFRFFYAIPFNLTISFAFIYLLNKFKTKLSLIIFIVFMVVLSILGDSPISKDHVIFSENNGKIPQYDYDINDVFKENSISGFKRVLVPLKTITNIKQVNPEILIVVTSGHQATKIDNEIENTNADIDYVIKYSNVTGCDYITLKTSESNKNRMEESGYKVIGNAEDYSIFAKAEKNNNEYDEFGNTTLFNTNANDDSFKYIEITYDNLGRMKKEKLLDINKNSIIYSGFSYVTKEYNKDNLVEKVSYYDNNDKLINTEYGFSSILNEYDSDNLICSRYYDKNNNICKTINGEYITNYLYDENNNLVEIKYLDNNGNLIDTNRGYAKVVNSYDENGNIIKKEYLSSNMDKVADLKGISSIDYIYENEKLIETKYTIISSNINEQDYNRIVHTYEIEQKINSYYLNNDIKNMMYEIEMPEYIKDIYEYLYFDQNIDTIEIKHE